MSQASLFPIKLIHEESTSGTMDLKLIGYSGDNVKFAVKREKDGFLMPLAEWIGYSLAQRCGIPTPDFNIVECMNGELAFGSKWEQQATQIKIFDSAARTLMSEHGDMMSQIFGLDFFLPNIDRHLGNFIFSQVAGIATCLAFDFSSSSVRTGLPFGSHPLAATCKTSVVQKLLQTQSKKFNKHRYNGSLAKLKEVTTAELATILNGAPDQWYSKVSKQEVVAWWESSKGSRIAQVVK